MALKNGIEENSNKQRVISNIVNISFIALIAYFVLHNIHDLGLITILNDEFGYWSNAALLAGYKWQTLAQHTPYYSLGYSLILFPLFLITNSTKIMYQMAIILNLVFWEVIYLFASKICHKIGGINKGYINDIFAGASVILSANIFNSQVAWTELYLTFLYWVMVYVFFKLEEQYKLSLYCVLTVVMMLMYITHMRSIGIFVSYTICSWMIFKTNRKKIAWYVVPVVIVVSVYFTQRKIVDFQTVLLGGERLSNLNNIAINSDLMGKYANRIINQFKDLLLSGIGKLLVLSFISLGSISIAYWEWFQSIKKRVGKLACRYDFGIAKTFIMLSSLTMLGLQILQATQGERLDIVVYSRYMEFTLGPVILLSLELLDTESIVHKRLLTISWVFTIIALFVVKRFSWEYSDEGFNIPCSPALGGVFEIAKDNIQTVTIVVLWLVAIVAIVLISSFKKSQNSSCLTFCVIFLFLQIACSWYAVKWLKASRDGFLARTVIVSEILSQYPDREIVYLSNGDVDFYCVDLKYLQFVLGNREINVIDSSEELDYLDDKNHYILIVNKQDSENYDILNDSIILGEAPKLWVYSVDWD